MGSWLVFLALFLFTALATVAKAESPHDIQNNAELADTIINELRTGQFDLLESQYRDFADRDHQTLQSDGTPRIWIYFWAFERSTINSPRIEEAQTITQKIRGWLEAKPNSIPALLALDNALLGESENIRNRTIAQHRDLKDPQVDQQLQRRTDEITSTMKAVLFDQISALMAEPQYYSATMHLYLLEPVGYDRVQILDHDIQRCDPYYVPFYANAVVWLAKRRTHDPALPRPEIWLTDRLKPGLLDSDDDVKRKTEAYARTISITDPQAADLKVELLTGLPSRQA